ncbi:MAG: MarR family transcriptional regulator [Aeromicrobium sp.]|uniref:MarR family winged helix-turn-helix transcriptional regulator n=1 Tax=Aeromicrobium sp. TaxID=1871063 RepID=UPI0025C20BF8|nr:MarR family transcriptional regulator [Aeromicrobium sp.]MDF1705640.1 MarR family transcriptional regulator [Aeromicrobium sp.]
MPGLDFDPIERAGELWEKHVGPADSMRLATSLMRVHQLVLAELDAAVRPHGITFARFEVLRLLSFSSRGSLPLSKIGQRLMVHPTSVTNVIDRLAADGLVDREADAADRRRVLASLTEEGRVVLDAATESLMRIDFGLQALPVEQQRAAFTILRVLRETDFEGG